MIYIYICMHSFCRVWNLHSFEEFEVQDPTSTFRSSRDRHGRKDMGVSHKWSRPKTSQNLLVSSENCLIHHGFRVPLDHMRSNSASVQRNRDKPFVLIILLYFLSKAFATACPIWFWCILMLLTTWLHGLCMVLYYKQHVFQQVICQISDVCRGSLETNFPAPLAANKHPDAMIPGCRHHMWVTSWSRIASGRDGYHRKGNVLNRKQMPAGWPYLQICWIVLDTDSLSTQHLCSGILPWCWTPFGGELLHMVTISFLNSSWVAPQASKNWFPPVDAWVSFGVATF